MAIARTDDPYRLTASNHIYAIKYIEEEMNLCITFHNGAEYIYYGVPKGHYEAMMASKTHGTYFWMHIRQEYECKLLGMKDLSKSLNPKTAIQYEICPELVKLDKEDEKEIKLQKQFKRGMISTEIYSNSYNAIQVKKERLFKKLEKDGYFSEDSEEVLEDSKNNEIAVGNIYEHGEVYNEDTSTASYTMILDTLIFLGKVGVGITMASLKIILVCFMGFMSICALTLKR